MQCYTMMIKKSTVILSRPLMSIQMTESIVWGWSEATLAVRREELMSLVLWCWMAVSSWLLYSSHNRRQATGALLTAPTNTLLGASWWITVKTKSSFNFVLSLSCIPTVNSFDGHLSHIYWNHTTTKITLWKLRANQLQLTTRPVWSSSKQIHKWFSKKYLLLAPHWHTL